METNAKVKMRGVQVGRVSQIGTAKNGASLKLEIDPDQIQYIPANVEAEIERHHRLRRQVRRPGLSDKPE